MTHSKRASLDKPGRGQSRPWAGLPNPNRLLDHYQRHLLDRWESLDTSKMYIMMEVGTDGVVINGGTGAADAGHIVITEPNQRSNRPGADPKKSFAVKSVEATGGHTPEGLWESWYTCSSYDRTTKVFSIFRESMDTGHKNMDVKIAAVT